jgi:hypothetical protein
MLTFITALYVLFMTMVAEKRPGVGGRSCCRILDYCQTFHVKNMIVHRPVVVVANSSVQSQSIYIPVLRDTTPKDPQII